MDIRHRSRPDRGRAIFPNLPYSIYPKSDFWLNSPGLILIKLGVVLVMLAVAFVGSIWVLANDGAFSGSSEQLPCWSTGCISKSFTGAGSESGKRSLSYSGGRVHGSVTGADDGAVGCPERGTRRLDRSSGHSCSSPQARRAIRPGWSFLR